MNASKDDELNIQKAIVDKYAEHRNVSRRLFRDKKELKK
jgi:hypothetical protein